VLGLINAIIRPILALLSCGCIVATLGLFMMVIKPFLLAGIVCHYLFNLGFSVENLGLPSWAALVVSKYLPVVAGVVDDRERKADSHHCLSWLP